MLFKDLNEFLEKNIAPNIFSKKFECHGIQYGAIRDNKNINKVSICLDISIDSIYYALKNKVDLIISHHPILKNPISNFKKPLINKLNLLSKYPLSIYVLNGSFISSENGISHTIAKILSLRIEYLFELEEGNNKIPIGRICSPLNVSQIDNNFTLRNLLERIKKNLNIERQKTLYVGNLAKRIKQICIVGGDTKDDQYIKKAIENNCDCYISSNLDHHQAILAKDMGICLVSISHYDSEIIALKKLRNFLSLEFPNDEFLIFESNDPFKVF